MTSGSKEPVCGKTRRGIVVHDADWQYPAITEQHAYHRVRDTLPEVEGWVYFAFPWATLIDLSWSTERSKPLREALEALAAGIDKGCRVFTVCQHVRLLDHPEIFESCGITDIFWSHAARGQACVPGQGGIRLHPFPLYPVQAVGSARERAAKAERPYLFSFIGAQPDEWYLTRIRETIFEKLGEHPRGLVRRRKEWHFRRTVYRSQIIGEQETIGQYLEEKQAAEYVEILRQSVFSLCPSGSGPNTLRLWESLALGAIPVVLSETWLPPGDEALWERAVVFCPESAEAVEAMPDRLEKITSNPGQMLARLEAIDELWRRYGDGDFIHDIRQMYEAESARVGNTPSDLKPDLAIESLLALAAHVPAEPAEDDKLALAFLAGCEMRLSWDRNTFLEALRHTQQLAAALARCRNIPSASHLHYADFK
jgi:hypothetical protein